MSTIRTVRESDIPDLLAIYAPYVLNTAITFEYEVPSVEEIVAQIKALLEVLPKEQLWINPDCGLKTRKWEEVEPSLKNMVEAVKIVRGL